MQRLPGHVLRLVAGQIDAGRGDVLGRAEPAHRNMLLGFLGDLLVQAFRHRRGDEARRDAIGGDVAGGDLARQRLGHADHAGLGRGIVALAGIAEDAADRGDVDDAAPAAAHHVAQHRAAQRERSTSG